jgi:3-dehydroquinate dehydratase-1
MIRIGQIELGNVPRVAVALSDADVRDEAQRVAPLVDVFELRIDRFSRHDPEYVAQVVGVARGLGVPLLATVRDPREGGEAPLSGTARLDILRAVSPWVDAIDIELDTEIRADVVTLCREHAKPVIVSVHDFNGTPSREELTRLIYIGKRAGGDIVKLATTATSRADVEHLLDVLRAHRDEQLIVIGMGDEGVVSRVFFPLFGSLLTWGFLNRVGAPGQLPVAELVDALCHYAPDFARRHGRG